MDLDDRGSEIIGKIDRMLVQHGQQPIAVMFTGVVDGIMGRIFGAQQRAAQPLPHSSQQPPPSSRSSPPPRPPPPRPNSPDPTIRAREILGFEPNERLTVELVRARKQALAKIFHPDAKGGSDAQMKRINAAADALLVKLS